MTDKSRDSQDFDRRSWLKQTLVGASAIAGATALSQTGVSAMQEVDTAEPLKLKGNIRHSVVHWCFNPMTVEQLAKHAVQLGIQSVELVAPEHWPMLKKHGLACAITSSHGFAKGWNHKENWDFCTEKITAAIEATSAAGFSNVITFSGMRDGIDEEEGLQNTIDGLKTVIGLAEKHKVNLCIEPLNTRVDENMKGHPGYQCDTVEWAVKVCDAIGSERMKILYDVYHQQIMQGDVIVRLKKYKDYIGHIHTAGVPGRRELDDAQEINYSGVMKAIVEIGYKGYVGHEFIPTWKDHVAALKQAVQVCDV